MAIIEFELGGTKIRFLDQSDHIAHGVTAKSGKAADLLKSATSTLEDAADAAAKLAQLFSERMGRLSFEELQVELALGLEGGVGFVFVNSKMDTSIKLKVTLTPPKSQLSRVLRI